MKKNNQKPLYIKLYESFRDRIVSGEIPPGTKMPSIRALSLKQQCSTTTAENAYQQLLIEGYVESRPKKGYFSLDVEAMPTNDVHNPRDAKKERDHFPNERQTEDLFDTDTYRKIMNTLFVEESDLYSPCLSTGERRFKEAIQYHLRTMRDVYTQTDNIVVASGIQQLLLQITPFIGERSAAYLKPGFKRAITLFETLDYTMHACEDIDALIDAKPNLIYLSPSNTYPSGNVIPIGERQKLIKYARDNDAYIVEDDYNFLFRYNAYQIPAIHSLSKGNRVIYVGSFSRNTLISFRMSYMVLPDTLRERYDPDRFTQTISKIDQLTMARFIIEGHYQRHLKRLANRSKKKNDSLKFALKPYLNNDDEYSIYGLQSNMHFVISTNTEKTKKQILNRLHKLNFTYRTFRERPGDIVVPYSGIPNEKMENVIGFLLG